MQATKVLGEALKEQIANIDERFPGYQARLIKGLVEIIREQGPFDKQRRDQIEDQIGAIANQLIASKEGK